VKTELRNIGQYTLLQRLGGSSRGETWKAIDSRSQRFVAIKFLRISQSVDVDSIHRLKSSGEAIASLHHPHIVQVHDFQVLAPQQSGNILVYVVMEYIEGSSLSDYIRSTLQIGKMPSGAEIVNLFTSLSMAIDYAHQHSIIHGDLKPANILLSRNDASSGHLGVPNLTDFGLSRLPGTPPNALLHRSVETARYTSPEQAQGQIGSKRSDLYSLGVMLYELCTGIPPFHGNRPVALMMQHINGTPPPPVHINPNISPVLSEVILHGLAKNPLERYASASAMTLALTQAIGVPVPESLSQVASQADTIQEFHFQNVITTGGTSSSVSSPLAARSHMHVPIDAPSLINGQHGTSFPTPASHREKRAFFGSWYLIAVLALLIASMGTLGALFLSPHPPASVAPGQVVGHAFFHNSGQFDPNSPNGLNDELQIDLSGIPDPASGKSYYAWLLADSNQSEASPILLSRLTVNHGVIHFLYQGTQQHTNLLAFVSRFLITEDDIHNPTGNPLIDTGTWRYYAEIPQLPNPTDTLHFSMLDHLRHLLVESPELTVRGLHGGLAFWFARNTATVSEQANSARDAWHSHDALTIHDQVIHILDYLDGTSFVHTDVPEGTPLLADPRAAQVALLGPVPQNPGTPGYTYNDEVPPGYVYLISEHMEGAIQSPQTTPEQRKLAISINAGIDAVRRLFEQVQQECKQLLDMNNAQLFQTSSLSLLNNLATQLQEAYTGQLDPATGQSNGGALWIYGNLQRLATFEVRPFAAQKTTDQEEPEGGNTLGLLISSVLL
jgi:serine/threonine protein kinase